MRRPTKQSSALRTAKSMLEDNLSTEIEMCDNTMAVLHMLFPCSSDNKSNIRAFYKEGTSVGHTAPTVVVYIYTYMSGQKRLCFRRPALPYMDDIIAAVEALEDEGGRS